MSTTTSEVDTHADFGYALDWYSCPKHGQAQTVRGGTMSKAVNSVGGVTDELKKNVDKAPGPGSYFKDNITNFVKIAKGGTFSKLAREGAKKLKGEKLAPGDYNVNVPLKVKGGLMTKNDRICAFAKMAERKSAWNKNGPGQYDVKIPSRNTPSPTFVPPRTESRQPTKPSQVGPGYYNPDYRHCDKKNPSIALCKEAHGTFMMQMNKDRADNPFATYKDMPDSKISDRIGKNKHCKKLLHDRPVFPRAGKKNSIRSATPRLPLSDIQEARASSATPRPKLSSRQQPTPRQRAYEASPRDVGFELDPS